MTVKLVSAFCMFGIISIGAAQADQVGGNYAELLRKEQAKTASLETQSKPIPGSALRGEGASVSEAPAVAPGKSHLRKIVAKHAAENGVPFSVANAVVMVESRYNPRVSNGGALGLMQIKPATARGVGFEGPASRLYDAETNIRYGMRYLASAYRKADGDLCRTVSFYQSGLYTRGISGANRAYCGKARGFMTADAG